LVQNWTALEAVAHSGRIENHAAAELLRRQLPLRTAFPPAEQDAATSFYFWIASWYPAEVFYETAEMALDDYLAQTQRALERDTSSSAAAAAILDKYLRQTRPSPGS
jgi:hypothetical protein